MGLETGNRHQGLITGEPNKCRFIARSCEELAAKADDPATKERLRGLAAGWNHLAAVLETTQEIKSRFGKRGATNKQ
jgi:hypothetical protein